MGYEKSKFGDAGYTSGTTNVQSNVSNHYGQRNVGGGEGRYDSDGAYNEAVVNFDATGPLYTKNVIPAGAVVTQIFDAGATGAITAATVGATDISGADGTELNYVSIATAGELTITGPTAGTVVVRFMKTA